MSSSLISEPPLGDFEEYYEQYEIGSGNLGLGLDIVQPASPAQLEPTIYPASELYSLHPPTTAAQEARETTAAIGLSLGCVPDLTQQSQNAGPSQARPQTPPQPTLQITMATPETVQANKGKSTARSFEYESPADAANC